MLYEQKGGNHLSFGETEGACVSQIWRTLFPWLDSAVELSTKRGADETSELQLKEAANSVAEIVLNNHMNTPLRNLMPALNEEEEIPWKHLGARGKNILLRHGIPSLPALLDWTPRDIMDLPAVGHGTMKTMLTALATYSWECAAHTKTASTLPDHGLSGALLNLREVKMPDDQPLETTSALHIALDDLRTLARWQVISGADTSPILSADYSTQDPEHVHRARQRLLSLTADTLVDTQVERPAAYLESFLTMMDERETSILRERTFADRPLTLDALGHQLGVTRERVRQIEKKAELKLSKPLDSTPIGDLAAAIRTRINKVCSLNYLLATFPALNEPVPSAGQSVWRLVDRLDDTFEILDGWAAVPSVDAVREQTRSIDDSEFEIFGVSDLSQVAFALALPEDKRGDELRAWLDYCGCEMFENYVSSRQLPIPDWADLILRSFGSPLSIEEIAERMPVDRAVTSIRNALAEDDRFVRADRDRFALTLWGGPNYTGIRDAIEMAIDLSGGSTDLEALVQNLTTQFTVAASSVRAYAQAHPFESTGGKVRRRDGKEVFAANPSGSKRLYRVEDGWALRIKITRDHARGSGSVLPNALAVLIGLSPGDTLGILSIDGTQSVYWTGIQPSLGSIRRLLEPSRLSEGEWAFAIFADKGWFSLIPLRTADQGGIDQALALAGSPWQNAGKARAALALALSLPMASSWPSIIGAAQNRGDNDLADAIIADPELSFSRTEFNEGRTVHHSEGSVEEILRLL